MKPTAGNSETVQQTGSGRGDADLALGRRLRQPQTWVSFGLALAIIIFVFRGLDIDLAATWSYMRTANPWLMLSGLAVFYLTFPLRAVRWRLLLVNARVPLEAGRHSWAALPALIEYLYLSWFANCIVPAKLGDAYRGYLLKRNGGVSFSATFGTIFAERLLDMIGLFLLLLITGLITFGAHIPAGTEVVFLFGALLVLLIVGGLLSMRWLSPLIRRFVPDALHVRYGSFAEAALGSFSRRILPQLSVATALIWLLEGSRLYLVMLALGRPELALGAAPVIFIALASSLLTALPITPAGLGVVEGTVTLVLTLFAVPPSLGSAVTLLDRLINFWSIVIFGFVLYLISRRK